MRSRFLNGVKGFLSGFTGRDYYHFTNDSSSANRASVDDMMSAFLDGYSELRPDFPVQVIDIFKLLAFINPDVSQAVQKFVNLGNQGHSVDINNGSDRVKDAALEELNWLSRNGFGNSAGADGFINRQFRQIAITGALCQETDIDLGFTGVREIYQVKSSSIRFRLENNSFVPFQKIGLKDIDLNPRTFGYIPLMSDEGSPYALPPFSAALRFLLRQEKQWNEIDGFTEIWGMLNYLHMKVKSRKGFNEMDEEFRKRQSRDFDRYRDMYLKKRKNGIAVTGDNVEMKNVGVSKTAAGIDTVVQNTEQMIASGMDIDPAMLGRSYSTTETYATVCYETLCGKLENIQRLIKRGNEQSYNLHLMLRKIPAFCSISFNKPPSLKTKEDMEAKEINQRMILERMNKGIISEDDAARELGYKKAYRKNTGGSDTITLDYDRALNKYVFNRPVVSLSKKKSGKSIRSFEEDYVEQFFEIFDLKCSEVISEIEECVREADPVSAIMKVTREKLQAELKAESKDLAENINSSVYYQELNSKISADSHSLASFASGMDFEGDNGEWKVTDQAAIDWFIKNDQFFFANQYKHYMNDLKEVVKNELKGVERAYDKKVVNRLREKMGEAFDHPKIRDYYDLVIRNAVNRSRNYARVYKYQRAGIAEMEVVAIIDKKTSRICREMNGRRIKTETAVEYVNKTIQTPLNELTEKFAWPSNDQAMSFKGMSSDEIMGKLKCKLPPYHGRCRTTTVISVSTNIKNSSGTVLNKVQKPKLRNLGGAGIFLKGQNEERLKEYRNLTPDEMASKINSHRSAQWHEKNLDKHFEKHVNDFDKYGNDITLNTVSEYDQFSRKLLADFNRCFIYRDKMSNRVMFYNKSFNCVVIVDSGTNRIVSCYPLAPGMKEVYSNKYMEIVHEKESYN